MIRLLYIDENSGILEIVKFCIEADDNFHVDTVNERPRRAWKRLTSRDYDGVLVDLHMVRYGRPGSAGGGPRKILGPASGSVGDGPREHCGDQGIERWCRFLT